MQKLSLQRGLRQMQVFQVPKILNVSNTSELISKATCVRSYHHTDWKMIRDVKRREMVKDYAVARLRLNCIRKNRVLPAVIKEIADQEIDAFPRDSNRHRVTNRCAITSRPRSVFRRWRLSRIMFRHLSDYNYLSGVQRGMW